MIDPFDRPIVAAAFRILEEADGPLTEAQVMNAARVAYMQGYFDAGEAEAVIKPVRS